MRIVLLTSSASKSGGSRQALYLAQGLRDQGHAVRFFVPGRSTLKGLAPDMDWQDLPEDPSRWKDAVWAQLEPMLRQGPAVLHAFHNRGLKLAAWWGLSWRRRGLACFAHRGVLYRPGNPLPYWSPGMDGFLVNSAAIARMLRRYAVPRRKLHVVYNGVHPSRTTPVRTAAEVARELGLDPQRHTVVGCVAGDKPYKGVEHLLRGYALLEGPAAQASRLLVVGVSRDKWLPLCRSLGIAERTVLHPRTEQVADMLQVMHCFALPSVGRHESTPNTLLEAVRMGLPAVATDVGGVAELIDGNGVLVQPADPASMARGLERALADPERLVRWAARSRELAPRYSLDHRVERVLEVYRNALERRGLEAA
jgi:glycosyltransferase involved in cell wall biosynthesis